MSDKTKNLTISGSINDDVRDITINGIGTFFELHNDGDDNYSLHTSKSSSAILKKVSAANFKKMVGDLKGLYKGSEINLSFDDVNPEENNDDRRFASRYLGDVSEPPVQPKRELKREEIKEVEAEVVKETTREDILKMQAEVERMQKELGRMKKDFAIKAAQKRKEQSLSVSFGSSDVANENSTKDEVDIMPLMGNLLDYAASRGKYEYWVNGKFVGKEDYKNVFDGNEDYGGYYDKTYIPTNLWRRETFRDHKGRYASEFDGAGSDFERACRKVMYGHIYRGFINNNDYKDIFGRMEASFTRDIDNLYPSNSYGQIWFGEKADGDIARIRAALRNAWNTSPDDNFSDRFIKSNDNLKSAVYALRNIKEKDLIASPYSEATTEGNRKTYKGLVDTVKRWGFLFDLVYGEYALMSRSQHYNFDGLNDEAMEMARANVENRSYSYHQNIDGQKIVFKDMVQTIRDNVDRLINQPQDKASKEKIRWAINNLNEESAFQAISVEIGPRYFGRTFKNVNPDITTFNYWGRGEESWESPYMDDPNEFWGEILMESCEKYGVDLNSFRDRWQDQRYSFEEKCREVAKIISTQRLKERIREMQADLKPGKLANENPFHDEEQLRLENDRNNGIGFDM